MLPPFLQAMLQPNFHGLAPGTGIELIQTHISFVVLAGERAYKIKKPVHFEFVDYSSLAQRRAYCHAELRFNQRFSPELYLGVQALVFRAGHFALADADAADALEYCVVMRRFSDDALLSGHATLPVELDALERFAEHLAAVHLASPVHAEWGEPDSIHRVIDANFLEMEPFAGTLFDREELNSLRTFLRIFCEKRRSALVSRAAGERIRECHGDLHLGNLVALGGDIHAFDCIEFNDSFRLIDVMSDVAFLTMDLMAGGFGAAANRFLNAYLEHSGDWEGVGVFPLYLVYRAFVRAKILALTSVSAEIPAAKKTRSIDQARRYFALARELAGQFETGAAARLAIMHGPSGSGKSTVAKKLALETGAIHIRSDAVRKHLAKRPLKHNVSGAEAAVLYSAEQTEQTYARMNELAETALMAGFPVILDARFAMREQRAKARSVADRIGIPFEILVCAVPAEELRRRLQARRGDVSDATPELIEQQARETDVLSVDESRLARIVSG